MASTALRPPKNGGRALSVSGRKPHILVDSDPQLAGSLWLSCSDEEKPFLLCTNPHAPSIGDPLIPGSEVAYRLGLSLEGLIECKLHGGSDKQPEVDLTKAVADVRSHFSLSDHDPIRIALAGSHSTISGGFDSALTHMGVNKSRPKRNPIENALRKGRTLAGLVEAAFAEIEGFEPLWLSEAFSQLAPESAPGRYEALAKLAREKLATFEIPPYRNTGRKLKRPAVPLIYVTTDDKSGDEADWQELAPLEREHPYSVTQKLIEQFGARRRDNPGLRGVLVKLLPVETRDQNVLDAPMVGQSTLDLANQAGIEAILLDERYGVLRRVGDGLISEELVLGIPVCAGTTPP